MSMVLKKHEEKLGAAVGLQKVGASDFIPLMLCCVDASSLEVLPLFFTVEVIVFPFWMIYMVLDQEVRNLELLSDSR